MNIYTIKFHINIKETKIIVAKKDSYQKLAYTCMPSSWWLFLYNEEYELKLPSFYIRKFRYMIV